jgi:16S rRNA processing protein RimM
MQKDQLFYLGILGKPIGLKGELSFRFDCDNPAIYQHIQSLFVEGKMGIVPYRVSNLRLKHGMDASIQLDQVNTIDKADFLKGSSVFLPLTHLPALEGNNFYYHEIIGYELIDINTGSIGKIKDVLEYPQHDLFQIMHSSGKEILIPVRDELIEALDRATKTIRVNVPEGLVDIYLADTLDEEE